jgi:alcohol dehydrogenase/NADPH2:quinone reductase
LKIFPILKFKNKISSMNPSFLKAFKAIGLFKSEDLSNLHIFDYTATDFRPRDLLIKIKSIALNPVDAKKRAGGKANISPSNPLILGYDATGIVEETGPEVQFFKKGDEVYYAGDITRNGSNAQYQIVDERIVGLKPKNLNFNEAAALPLVTLTAWECLIESIKIPKDHTANKEKTILIISGAGGVG